MNLRETPLFGFNQSGATYVTNVLLELGACSYPEDFGSHWEVEPDGRYRVKDSYRRYLGCYYPRLMEEDVFEFPSGEGIRFTHGPPAPHELGERALHLVRDPRGVALSLFDRFGGGRTLEDFLGSACNRDGPLSRPHALLGLYPTECWALFSSAIEAAWRDEETSGSLLSLRFEELKASPVLGMHAVLEHVGITATDEEILGAVERSSKEAAARAEEAWRAMYPEIDSEGTTGVKRGRTGGWEQHFGAAELRALGAMTHEAMTEFGYGQAAPIPAVSRERPMGDTPKQVLMETVQALRGSAGSTASRLELGLRIRACDQALQIFGQSSESQGARRALARMLELYGLSEGRALHWISAYQGLNAVGDNEGARFALEVGVSRSSTLGELMESALQLSHCGEHRAALGLVEQAADTFGCGAVTDWDRRVQARAERSGAGPHQSPAVGLLARLGWTATRPAQLRIRERCQVGGEQEMECH